MSTSLIPFRTYAAAAALSLALNLGAIGTFATVRIPHAAPSANGAGSLTPLAPLVLSDLTSLPMTLAKDEPIKPDETNHTTPPSKPPTPPNVPPPQPPQPEVPRVRLGNPDSPESASNVWLGVSKDAGTPNSPRGTVDQGDFRPGHPGPPTDSNTPQPSREPTPPTKEESRSDRTPSPNTPATPPFATATTPTTPESTPPKLNATSEVAAAGDTPQPIDRPETDAPGDVTVKAPPATRTDDPFAASLDLAREAAVRVTRQLKEALAQIAQPLPQDPDRNEPSPTPSKAAPSNLVPKPASQQPSPPAARPSGQNGNGADRESDAFSKSEPTIVRPGQPLAGKGLRINTVAPRWTTATRVLYRFQNPTVRVKFGRSGKVLRAAYLNGKDAGHPDVSGPLMDAILRWTAQGDELQTIPADDPQAGVVLEFKILLN